VIEPGATLSLAGVLGAPTPDRGFVVAADAAGRVVAGGGADRLATALFNAALAAGLDIAERQNHPVPVPDIPPPHDAALGFPHPDVAVRNPTAHGILVWTATDGPAVSVTLYSTRTWTVSFTPAVAAPNGTCVEWSLGRTRTALADGRTTTDRISALYHPAGPC
jgi:vancomycin resistance protein YoaR